MGNAHPVNPGEPQRRNPRAATAHDAPAEFPAGHRPIAPQQGTGSAPAMQGHKMPKVNRNYAD